MARTTRCLARILLGADHRPAEGLGGDEALLVGREAAGRRLGPHVRAERVAARLGLAEDVRETAARLGRRGAPVVRPTAVGRQAREPDDRPSERVVSDLGPPGIGRDVNDEVAVAACSVQELAEEPRLADAVVADDPRRDDRGVDLEPLDAEPVEIVLARGERHRELGDAGVARGARRGCCGRGSSPGPAAPDDDARAAFAAELLAARHDGAARRAGHADVDGEAPRADVARAERVPERLRELIGGLVPLAAASFSSALSVTSTSGSGRSRSGATVAGSGGGSDRCIRTTCVGLSASNGKRPVRS